MNKEQWAQRLKQKSIEEIGGQGFDVNDWGSCQYSGALAMYNTFQKIRKDLSYDDTLLVLGLKVTFEDKRDIDTIQAMILEKFSYNDFANDFTDEIPKTKNVDDFFDMFNDCGWDLWSTASFMAPICFGDLVIEGVPEASGYGPIGNQLVQSHNYNTGLICVLLVEHEMVEDTDCFSGFDT